MASPKGQPAAGVTTYRIPDRMKELPRELFTITDKLLGEGGFAKVVVGIRTDTKEKYAVKIMNKAMCAKAEKSAFINVQNEIDIISELDHPSVVNCVAIFQDNESLYFALEFCEGGELFKYMKKYGLEDMCDVAKNFVAECILALDYMLSKNIAHRDIKPENLLLTKDFHVKIADFGTACKLDSDADNKFSGTAWYVSPELLINGKAGRGSDLWALGCVVYQLFVGSPPFKRDSDYLTFQAIKQRDLTFPPYFPPTAGDLVGKLLTLDPAARFGCGPGGMLAECKAHPFFAGLDWSQLHTTSVKTHINADYTSEWNRFLLPGEEVVYASMIVKTRHFSTKNRHLVLTTFPRLFYVDPGTLDIKGQVPWSDDIWASASGSSDFNVVTPGRTYNFTDAENHAHIWASKINSFVKMKKTKK